MSDQKPAEAEADQKDQPKAGSAGWPGVAIIAQPVVLVAAFCFLISLLSGRGCQGAMNDTASVLKAWAGDKDPDDPATRPSPPPERTRHRPPAPWPTDTQMPWFAGPPPATSQPVTGPTPSVIGVPSAPPSAESALLEVSWSDGTAELQDLVAQLSDEERKLIGLSVLLTGTDLYGAKVRLVNRGDVPIRVFPENVRVHFGEDSTAVSTIDHPQFLRRCVMNPAEQVEGLVIYRATVEIGATIRLGGGGTLSYDDQTITVRYK